MGGKSFNISSGAFIDTLLQLRGSRRSGGSVQRRRRRRRERGAQFSSLPLSEGRPVLCGQVYRASALHTTVHCKPHFTAQHSTQHTTVHSTPHFITHHNILNNTVITTPHFTTHNSRLQKIVHSTPHFITHHRGVKILAAQSSSRRLVVRPSVRPSVGRSDTFLKK